MRLLAALFVGLVISAASIAADKPAFDAAKLEGTWKIATGMKYGDKIEGKSIEGDVVFSKDTITIKGSDMTHIMTFKLDAKASPVAITMTGKEGPAAGMTAEGIIELKDGELKLCYSFPGEKRPTNFESKKDSKILMFTLKKAK